MQPNFGNSSLTLIKTALSHPLDHKGSVEASIFFHTAFHFRLVGEGIYHALIPSLAKMQI